MKKLNTILWFVGLLILILPCCSWLLIRLYQNAIHIPRAIVILEKQEGQILAAIAAYSTDHGSPPEQLFELVPAYITNASLTSGKEAFHYNRDETGNFVLSLEIPSSWSSWPIRRVCLAGLKNTPSCSYHYVCSVGKGGRYLTEPLTPDDFRQDLLVINQPNPCFPPES